MILVEYNSNNSGGNWWLEDKDWKALEKAGWLVIWASKSFDYNKKGFHQYDKNGFPKLKNKTGEFVSKKKDEYRYLGALAKSAYKKFNSIKEAIEEFEKVTDQTASDEGCNCCGAPHEFSWQDPKTHKNIDYCSGEECLKYLYKKIPRSLRDACEKLKEDK